MWIEVEPGDFPMMRYLLCFEPGDPDPEDRHVRTYLQQHRLEPRREWADERQGTACRIIQFGQCYLGRHLQVIDAMRSRGIVAGAVAGALRQMGDDPRLPAAEEMGDLAWAVAERMLAAGAVAPSQGDPTQILMDPEVLDQAVAELAGATS